MKYLLLLLFFSGCSLIPKSELVPPSPSVADVVQEVPPVSVPQSLPISEYFEDSVYKPTPQNNLNNQVPVPNSPRQYMLKFDAAPLAEVVQTILSGILSFNYTMSPNVTGSVNLQLTNPLTKEELIPVLQMLLQMNGAALTKVGDIYQIKPVGDSLYSSALGSLSTVGIASGYQTLLVPVKFVSASDLADFLKPLVPEKTVLHVDRRLNIILVAGSGADLVRLRDIVNVFDVDIFKGRSFAMFNPVHISPAKAIDELLQLFDLKPESADLVKFIELSRLNAFIAVSTQPHYLKQIEQWLVRLDRVNPNHSGVNVYRVQHVAVDELAKTLTSIYQSSNFFSTQSPVNPSALVAPASSSQLSEGATKPVHREVQQPPPQIKIIPDVPNNSLVIVAPSHDYENIKVLLQQLDVLPLQVLIDVNIVEVALVDDLQFGINWYLTHKVGGNNTITGGSDSVSLKSVAAGVASGGFTYAFSNADIQAVLKANATNNRMNVISSPSLMVTNNQKASISVGDSVPVRSSVSTNLNNSNGVQTSSIQMVDTGVRLSVTPRVNSGGLVTLTVNQGVSEASKTTTSDNIDSPTIQKRDIETQVSIQSGNTIVLGGLIKDKVLNNDEGVPLLHSLPILGPFFGGTSINNTKTELVVMLTPRVVSSRADVNALTTELQQKLSVYR